MQHMSTGDIFSERACRKSISCLIFGLIVWVPGCDRIFGCLDRKLNPNQLFRFIAQLMLAETARFRADIPFQFLPVRCVPSFSKLWTVSWISVLGRLQKQVQNYWRLGMKKASSLPLGTLASNRQSFSASTTLKITPK